MQCIGMGSVSTLECLDCAQVMHIDLHEYSAVGCSQAGMMQCEFGIQTNPNSGHPTNYPRNNNKPNKDA